MEKRGLGRGLAALFPEAEAAEAAGRIREIGVDQIAANPYQPRALFDASALLELEQSIREHGILQPILVRETAPGRFQVVAGERRLRAAQNAGLQQVPALVRACDDREMLEIALVENVQREDISAVEAARAYRRMGEEFGLTQEAIARRVGKTRTSVANALRLLLLPAAVQESLERGEISEGHGRALMMAERPEAILETWRALLRRGLSVRETERMAKVSRTAGRVPESGDAARTDRVSGQADLEARGFADPNEARVLERLQHALGTRVHVRRGTGGGGRIEIEFYSDDELERLVQILIARDVLAVSH